jgi:hypothetical protein
MNHRDNERAQKGVKILPEARHKIRHFLILLWYFLTEKSPAHTMIEEKLEHMPERKPNAFGDAGSVVDSALYSDERKDVATVKARVWVGMSRMGGKNVSRASAWQVTGER